MSETAQEWAAHHYGRVALGDQRLNRLAQRMAGQMAAQPQASLPQQMQSPRLLRAAYGLLNHPGVRLEALTAPHRAETLRRAGEQAIVLLAEDTTELDYTRQRAKTGLGPIGNGRGRGVLLHSTLAIVPERRQVLGLAHLQVVLRVPRRKGQKWARSAEGRVWEVSAERCGRPPLTALWVHVSDSASDIYEYLVTCLALGQQFLVRAFRNRALATCEAAEAQKLLDAARQWPAVAGSAYAITVPGHGQAPDREALIVLAWGQLVLMPPREAPQALRQRGPLRLWVLRAWEPEPPAGAEAVEWVLLSSLPIPDLTQARRLIGWYTCRWLCEDFHQCLKTGCRVEDSQLDDEADLERLLGFAAPLAVRLLQLRQEVRQWPEERAIDRLEPLMVKLLAQHYQLDPQTLSLGQFYRHVAILGGYQGRKGDGPPGWRTLWHGWRYLSDLTAGARLVASGTVT